MKKSLSLCLFIFLFALISFFFESCSNELEIAAPLDEFNANSIQNQLNIPDKPDTMVYLPNSKMLIGIKKGLSTDKLAKLDIYFSTHDQNTKMKKVTPMLPQCGYHTEYVWLPANIYKPVSNKTLGIWLTPSIVSYSDARNLYGFKEIHINDINEMNTALAYGWQADSMMLSYNNLNQQILNVGSFYIDEPYEHDSWNLSSLLSFANCNGGKRILLGSYKMGWMPYNAFNSYGTMYNNCINQASNLYMMCDKYTTDFWGNAVGYWLDFKINTYRSEEHTSE